MSLTALKKSTALRIGSWRVDPALDEISKDGKTVKLERRSMQLLLCLADHAGQVVSVEELLDQVWTGVVVTPGSVYQAVASLRRLLGDDSKEPAYIANVPRRGYRLVAPVAEWVEELERPVPSPAASAHGEAVAAVQNAVMPGEVIIARIRSSNGPIIAVGIVLLGALSYAVLDRAWLSKRVAVHGAMVPAADKSIAVLPFVDLSEKHDQEYFADGMSEELMQLLAQVPDLKVPARTSSFYFKGKQATIAQIGKELGVANVLEGSVRKAGNTIRVTVQLSRADNGYHLWAKTYDRDLQDVFKVQDEIAAAVVDALKLRLAPMQQIGAHRTANTEAYNQFLLGRQFFNRGDPDGWRHSIDAYRKAIDLDPHYAAAYVGLALSEEYLADWVGDGAGLKRAAEAADKAIALAPDEADGYAMRADLRASFDWDWAGAQADLEKALALDPSDGQVQRQYGFLLAGLGRLPEAIAAQQKATQLDALSNLAWRNLGRYLVENGDFAAAREALRRALEIEPQSARTFNYLGTLQLLEGDAASALATFRKITDDEAFRLFGVSMAEHTLNNPSESQRALDELIAKHAQEAAYQIAEVYAWRGEKDKAFEWLDRALAQRDGGLFEIKFDALLAGLRADPRYTALLRKMNLPL
jgi:TolB-like protein/DNA-binding winged helix-turn-helix (wHTH) protein